MSKGINKKASELFSDPDRPMTYGWLEQVMAKKAENTKSKPNVKKNLPKKSKRPQQR